MDEKNINMMEEEIVAEEEAVKEEDMTDIDNDVYEFDCNDEKPKSIVDKIKEFGVKCLDFAIDHPMLTKCVAVGGGALIAYGIGVKVGEKNSLADADKVSGGDFNRDIYIEFGRIFGKAEVMDALVETARQGAEIDSEK